MVDFMGGDLFGSLLNIVGTISNIASKCDTPAPAPAPRVEIVNPPAPPVIDRPAQPSPPININLTINVYKNGDDEPVKVVKTKNGIGLNLK